MPLAGREFALLEYFLRHEDEVLTRSRIIDEVWDWAFDGTPRIIDVYVRALRARLGRAQRRHHGSRPSGASAMRFEVRTRAMTLGAQVDR